MRKKSALAMDIRYVTMIENAFFFVNPPEGGTLRIKERPPLHSFIRKILYQDLSKPTTDKVKFPCNRLILMCYLMCGRSETKNLSYRSLDSFGG